MNGFVLRKAVLVVLATAITVATLFPVPATAASYGRAGVVVVHGDGTVVTDCVRLDRPEMSGFKLLKQSSFEYRKAHHPLYGPAICWIDGEGVDTTDPDDCFSDPDANFWGYWTQNKGEAGPAESPVGAGERVVRRGAVDYWVWDTYPQDAPDALTVSEICDR
jgi:hypothetical protein